MAARTFDDLLGECLDMLQAGVSIEDCVAPYPEHAGELREQLRVAQTLLAGRPVAGPRPAAHSLGRARLLSAVAEATNGAAAPARPGVRTLLAPLGRLAFVPQVLPALLVLVLLGGTAVGVSAAATGNPDPTAPIRSLVAPGRQQIELEGTITSIGESSLTLLNAAGSATVLITPETELKGADGASIALSDLRIGDHVKVHAVKQSDGTLVAREVELEDDDGGQGQDEQNDNSGPGNRNEHADDENPGQGDEHRNDNPGQGDEHRNDDNPGQGDEHRNDDPGQNDEGNGGEASEGAPNGPPAQHADDGHEADSGDGHGGDDD